MPAPLCCVEKEFQAFRHRLSAHVLKDPVKVFYNSRCEDHALSQDLVTITLLRRSKAILDKFYIPNLFAWVRHQKLKQFLGITSDMVQLELFPTQSFAKVVDHGVESFQGGFSHSRTRQRKRRLVSHQQGNKQKFRAPITFPMLGPAPHFQERQHLEGDQSLGRGSFSNQFPQLTSFVSTIASLPLSSLHLVSSFMRCRPKISKK